MLEGVSLSVQKKREDKETKSIVIIYFSGTGNTEAITNLLSDNLESAANVKVFKLEDILKQKKEVNLNDFDLVGFGYPIHGFDAPSLIYKYVKTLEKVDSKKAFIYFTCAGPLYFNSNSTIWLKNRLKRKGFDVFYERIFYMPANILTPYNDEVCKQLYNVAIPKTEQMAQDILDEKQRLRKDPLIIRILLSWMYFFEKRSWKFIGMDFNARKNCTLCKKCINSCPRDNIVLKKGKIKFKMKCIGCYRCVYSCPEIAIKGRLWGFAIIKRGYDIKKIIANTDLKGNYITEKTRCHYRIFRKYLNDVNE